MRIWVPGRPRTKGSMKSFWPKGAQRAVMVQNNPESRAWQSRVTEFAFKAGLTPYKNAVSIVAVFNFQRPASHLNKKGLLRDSAPQSPGHSCGDVDKLLRNVLDALTGLAYYDDSQVVALHGVKRYCDFVYPEPGAYIEVEAYLDFSPKAKTDWPTLFDTKEE